MYSQTISFSKIILKSKIDKTLTSNTKKEPHTGKAQQEPVHKIKSEIKKPCKQKIKHKANQIKLRK